MQPSAAAVLVAAAHGCKGRKTRRSICAMAKKVAKKAAKKKKKR
jgi:hypothetical protein